jgi:hypothetical protein
MARDRREAVQDKKGGRIIYKGLWTKEEDDNLRKLVAGMKELPSNKIWVSIGEAMKQRNGKQCRERWLNHLSPDIRKGVWSEVRHPTCHTIVGGNLVPTISSMCCSITLHWVWHAVGGTDAQGGPREAGQPVGCDRQTAARPVRQQVQQRATVYQGSCGPVSPKLAVCSPPPDCAW